MKKLLILLAIFIGFIPSIATAINITVPAAPGAGYTLMSTTTGAYIATSTPYFTLGWTIGATSTGSSGVNLSGGCFAINGICIGTGAGSGTVTSVATTYPVTGGTFTTSGTIALAFGTSTLATTTSIVWTDLNNSNTINNGTISFPFKSISSMLAGLWTGASAYAFNLAPATYVDGAPDTFPNVPFALYGNESTYVAASGVTFPNSFDIYDLTIAGNVHESDNTLTTIHQFTNGVISGNLQMDGNATVAGEAVLGGQYFLISTSSLTNIAGSFVQNPIWANGVVNINDDQVSTSTPQFLVTATTTSFTSQGQFGNVNILGATLINTSGPGLNLNNGATSTPNNVFDASAVYNSTHSLIVGNSKTTVCGYQSYNLAGTFIAPEASSTAAWMPCIDEKLNVLNGLQLTNLGTPAGAFLAVDPSGNVIATTTPSGGGGSGTVGSGTTGQFPYYAANGTTLTATSSLFLATNQRIGIGTTTPGSILSIAGVANFTTATSTFYGNGLNLTSGCYAINGTCISSGSGTVTSVAANNGITGGTITTSGTLSLDQTFGAVWTAASSTYTQHLALNTASTTQFSSPTIWDSLVGNALWLGDANGKATAYGGSSNPCAANQAPTTLSSLGALGGCTSTFLTGNQTITLTGDVTGTGATSIATTLAMGNPHWWTATQNFTNASTSELTATSSVWLTGLTAGDLIATDANDKLVSTTSLPVSLLNTVGATNGFVIMDSGGTAVWAATSSSGGTNLGYTAWGGSIATTFATTTIASTTPGWFQEGLYASSTSQIAFASTTAWSTTSTSTGTFGINLSGGCFAVNGTCVTGTGGSGTILSGNTGQFPYYAGNGTTLTATSALTLATNGNILVGLSATSAPDALLTVANVSDENTPSNNLFEIASSTVGATTTLFTVANSGQTTINNTNSNAAALALNVQLSGVSKMSVREDGYMLLPGTGLGVGTLWTTGGTTVATLATVAGVTSGMNFSNNIRVAGAAEVGFQAATIPTNGFIVSGNTGIGTSSPWGILSAMAPVAGTSSPLFVVASSTPTSTSTAFMIASDGHVIASSTNPALTSCGTAPTMSGDDTHGIVTVGSTATGCTITFQIPYSAAPECTLTNQGMSVVNAMTYTVSASAIVVSQTALSSDVLDYQCEGVKGPN